LAKLDILIDEIASILGLTQDEVSAQFTEAELDILLNHAKCEPADSTSPLFDSLDVPCEDIGAPVDPDDNTDMGNVLAELKRKNGTNGTNRTKDEETLKCVETVSELNKEIEANLDLAMIYRILLERMNELKDNIVGLDFYFTERIKRAAVVLNDFGPTLKLVKNNKATIAANIKKINIKNNRVSTINSIIATSSDTTVYDAELNTLNSQIKSLTSKNKNITLEKLIVKKLKHGVFYNWFNNKKKLGGQNKVPRLSNNRKYVEELLIINEQLRK
jgi:hypothetical protein